MKKLKVITFFLLFVEFINAQSPVFKWAKSMGGNLFEEAQAMTTDASGNIYLTGDFEGTADFDPGATTFNMTAAGSADIFVSKLDANGNFVWAKQLGGSLEDYGLSIAVDATGNVYTTGYFAGTGDFNPGMGNNNLTSAGGRDIFLSKLDASGNFVWARGIGGINDDRANSLALDVNGNIFFTGGFIGPVDFDPGSGTNTLTSSDMAIFIAKFNSSGIFIWARKLGSGAYEEGYAITLDAAGNIYSTGTFNLTGDFNPGGGTFNLTAAGQEDIYVAKLDATGNFVWAKSMGGAMDEEGHSIAVDAAGNVYTTGFYFGLADFNPGGPKYNLDGKTSSDIFISKLDALGNFVWARSMGGNLDDYGFSIAVDAAQNVYSTGHFEAFSDFDPDSTATFTLVSSGGYDIFISKLDNQGKFVWAKKFGGPDDDIGHSIRVDASDNVITTGFYTGTVDFDPGTPVFNMISSGESEIFIHKMSQPSSGMDFKTTPDDLTFYPNPVNGNQVFFNRPVSLQLMDMQGKLLMEATDADHINIEGLTKGIYIIRIAGGITSKLIVE